MVSKGGSGMPKRKRFEIRVSDEQFAVLKRTAFDRGFRSIAAYVQAASASDMRQSGPDGSNGPEIVAASIDRLVKEVRSLHTAQQAVFAAVDSLTRLFLTCIPEPPPETLDQAKRRARLRYDRYLLSVAQNMASDSRTKMTELMDRG
jgi:hypothetical protein